MPLKVLITGINGFAGRHLDTFLRQHDVEIYGTLSRDPVLDFTPTQVMTCDIRDAKAVVDVIDRVRPDRIFHFAAVTRESVARSNPDLAFQTNVVGTINLLEAIRHAQIDPVIVVAGSSAAYGLVHPNENPITEMNPYRPVGIYGVSKVSQSLIAHQYFLNHQMKVIRTCTFNYIGPGQSIEFACSSFAKQLIEIEQGIKPPQIMAGNLDASRDFTDVRDVIRAYWLCACQGQAGQVYNICSGQAYPIRDMLSKMITMIKAEVQIKNHPRRLDGVDVPIQIGDYSHLHQATDWKPTISFEQSLEAVLDDWRKRLRQKQSC